jgi:UDP-N-acetylmuramate: L-alanyl-gamma-D-glutamyl-meso-diaminopimelate ligase
MRAHLLGVAGAGMAPLAALLTQAGVDVSGSDVAFDPPMGPRLAAWGVRTFTGTDASHLDGLEPASDVVVVGNVCRRDHPLAVEAERRGLRRVSMPTALRELVFAQKNGAIRPVIAVAGTHGKTTTTAMLATILQAAGHEPGYLIGGIPRVPVGVAPTRDAPAGEPCALGRASRSLLGAAPWSPFVVEGDEYDSAFFEKQPKVWGYAPKAAILTSIEHDHVDVYPTAESYRAAFAGLLDRLPSEDDGGLLVANAADPAVVALVESHRPRCRVVWYAATDVGGRGFPAHVASSEPPTWTACEVGLGGDGDRAQPFDLFVGPTSAGRFGLGVFGVQNVSNGLAAIAMAAEFLRIPTREAAQHLARFAGVKRRQEPLVEPVEPCAGVALYDDFAHHPTAVDATLRGLRARHRSRTIVAVYEPRSATACRAMHQEAYAHAFGSADVVVLAPLGRSTIPEGERLDLTTLARAIEARGRRVVLASSFDAVVEATLEAAKPGSVVVCMSNGAFGGVTSRLREKLS